MPLRTLSSLVTKDLTKFFCSFNFELMKLFSIVSLANLSISFFLFMLPPLAYYIYNHVLTNYKYLLKKVVDNFFTAPTVLHPDPPGGKTGVLYLVPKGYREMENGERCMHHQHPEANHYQCAHEIAQAKWKMAEGQYEEHSGQGCEPKDK
jgi:hypothetical protein